MHQQAYYRRHVWLYILDLLPSNERGASAHARSIDRRATKDARGALTLRHKQKLERSLISCFIRGLEGLLISRFFLADALFIMSFRPFGGNVDQKADFSHLYVLPR